MGAKAIPGAGGFSRPQPGSSDPLQPTEAALCMPLGAVAFNIPFLQNSLSTYLPVLKYKHRFTDSLEPF